MQLRKKANLSTHTYSQSFHSPYFNIIHHHKRHMKSNLALKLPSYWRSHLRMCSNHIVFLLNGNYLHPFTSHSCRLLFLITNHFSWHVEGRWRWFYCSGRSSRCHKLTWFFWFHWWFCVKVIAIISELWYFLGSAVNCSELIAANY